MAESDQNPESIRFSAGSLESFKNTLPTLLNDCFKIISNNAIDKLNAFFDHLKDGLYVAFEFPYVDKLYRDSYYHFYSSKHREYQRDCIRLSFFNVEITEEDFEKHENHDKLHKSFCGFLVIRPLADHIIGRSVISPSILKENGFICCLVEFSINVQGVKLKCCGFPHASQTVETISCAETSVWSIAEYYGYKYQEYSPVLPSGIIEMLNKSSFRRLIPSQGLTIYQISQSIKDLGFSALIYARDNYQDDFNSLLYTYIESGIPVILDANLGNGRHAVVCIGHSNADYRNELKGCPGVNINGVEIIDSSCINNDYILIDDNLPPYQLLNKQNTSDYYARFGYNQFDIEHFVVPLYRRMYLEAHNARELIYSILKKPKIGIDSAEFKNKEYVIRLFLTSQRSFKMKIHVNEKMCDEMKSYLLHLKLPRFIWVAELSSAEDYPYLADTVIILDATGDTSYDSLCFLSYPQKRIVKNDSGQYTLINHAWSKFNIYRNNLKGEWCSWNL